MSDLLDVLPDFNIKPHSHLLHSLEKNDITTTDLVTLDPVEIARKCPLPLLDLRRLVSDVIEALQKDLNMLPNQQSTSSDLLAFTNDRKTLPTQSFTQTLTVVKTLDTAIDQLLGGGIPLGYITEIAGESAVGKTQFLLGLLLSIQLPPPQGLGKAAIYLSTEDPLNTARLQQLLDSHPVHQDLAPDQRPSFDHVHALTINSLEAQEKVIEYQLPLAVDRYNAGIVILDSVAANFRVDHETTSAHGLADRAADLTKLGAVLRKVATEYNVAVVVANQVSDRFAEANLNLSTDMLRSSSPAFPPTQASQSSNASASVNTERNAKLSLDHQQRFFTGWGDKQASQYQGLKTPALGLAWANQISARIVLKVENEDTRRRVTASNTKRRRFMILVHAPWTRPSCRPVEFTVEAQGLMSVSNSEPNGQHPELLDENLWDEDEEFP